MIRIGSAGLRLGRLAALVVLAACGSTGGADDAVDGTDVAADDVAAPDVADDDGVSADDDGGGTPDVEPDVVPDAADVADVPEDVEPEADGTGRTGCLVAAGLEPFWGNLHSHTSYSDGEGTPAEAFAYARNVAGLDVLIVTDHLEQTYLPPRWSNCRSQADGAYVPGAFLAACGYEYGSGFDSLFRSTGHNNVFFNASLFPIVQTDFHDFYRSLVGCPTCIGQFNHPGDETMQTWNDFEYHADVDERIALYEFNSGPAWELFFDALDAGWHVSPVWNQDNHSANWGTANDNRAGIWMSALTREALADAMRARRTFASRDRNAWIRAFADGDCWMGSDVAGVGPSVTVRVEAEDADATDVFTTVALFGPGGAAIDSTDCGGGATCSATFEVDVAGPTYVVARVSQADGQWLAAAPIWLAR